MESPRPTRVGVTQITSGPDVDENLEAMDRTVRRAVRDGAELVVVPECFGFLGPELEKLEHAESLEEGGPILDAAKALAADTGASLLLGGHWEKSPDPKKVYNACVHLEPSGTIRAVYRKIHLFDVELSDGTTIRESDTIAAGEEVVVTETSFGILGLSICYDVRFPELYRRLVDLGAVALAVPAAFTLHTGKDHWHPLLRARAIEQQCYVVAAAQTGRHFGKRMSYGHALIVDPWGTVLAQVGEGEGAAVATVDAGVVERVRASVPSLRHRRLG